MEELLTWLWVTQRSHALCRLSLSESGVDLSTRIEVWARHHGRWWVPGANTHLLCQRDRRTRASSQWLLVNSSGFYQYFFFYPFLLNLLRWHWLTKLYGLKVYNSTTHHLYTVLCVHHPKSSFSQSPFLSPYPPLPLHIPSNPHSMVTFFIGSVSWSRYLPCQEVLLLGQFLEVLPGWVSLTIPEKSKQGVIWLIHRISD